VNHFLFTHHQKKGTKVWALPRAAKQTLSWIKKRGRKSVVISHWKTRQKEVGVGKRVWGN
jgi:hypothetical protein